MTEATGSRAVSACSTPMSMFVSVTSQYSLLHGEDRHPRSPSSPPLSLDFLRLMDFRQRAFDIGQLEPVHLLRILLESSALRTRLPSHRRYVLTICIPFRIEYSKANASFLNLDKLLFLQHQLVRRLRDAGLPVELVPIQPCLEFRAAKEDLLFSMKLKAFWDGFPVLRRHRP